MQGASSFLAPLMEIDGVRCDFVERIDGVPVSTDREATVAALRPAHESAVSDLGFTWQEDVRLAEQVHGCGIAVVGRSGDGQPVSDVDGLVTCDPGICLGIYVADCGAIYIVDRRTGALGLLHSGKKGTEHNILATGLAKMASEFGTETKDCVVILAPCIRPPAYEVDFAAEIASQAAEVGVEEFIDCGICTTSDLSRYYSYRIEKGNTGRMLALLGRP